MARGITLPPPPTPVPKAQGPEGQEMASGRSEGESRGGGGHDSFVHSPPAMGSVRDPGTLRLGE